jgi:hypothetical protein
MLVASHGGRLTGTLIGDELAAAAVTLALTVVPLAAVAWRTFDLRKLMQGTLQVSTP